MIQYALYVIRHMHCQKVGLSRNEMRYMAITRKLRQKVCDGSLREMRQEAKWIFAYIRRYRAAVGIHILLGILGTALSLLSSVAMKTLIDVVTGFETGAIWSAAAWMAGLLLGSAAMQAAASRIAAIVDIRVQNGIQAEVYDCILRTDWVSLEQFRSGDLLNRLNTDVGAVAGGVTGLLPSFVSAAVQFLGSLIIILCYDPVMALIALIGAPLSVLCSRTLVRRMRGYNRRMKDISSEVMSFHEDSLRNLTSVKAFGIMDGFRDRMCAMQEKYRETYLYYNRFSVVAGFVMSVVGLLVSAGCFGWGAYRLWTHAISYGAMMMFLQLTTMLRSAFSALIGLVPSAISITTSAGRLMAIADLPEEPGARETAPIQTPCTVELRCDLCLSRRRAGARARGLSCRAQRGRGAHRSVRRGQDHDDPPHARSDPPGGGQRQPHRGGRTASAGLCRDARGLQLCAAGQHRLCRYDRRQPAHGASGGDGCGARLCARDCLRV